LIERLIQFCQSGRHRIEVYFDRAPVGQAGTIKHGRVQVYFVPEHTTADAAIQRRLKSLERSAKSWTVVTTDRTVQAAARAVHAQVIRADEFAIKLTKSGPGHEKSSSDQDEPLSEAELKEWEFIFKNYKEAEAAFEKAAGIEVVADELDHAVAQVKIATHPFPAEVEVAIFETNILCRFIFLFNGKRRGLGHIEDLCGCLSDLLVSIRCGASHKVDYIRLFFRP
jgi:predicted RNA-binding protein with PIN domain